MKVYWKKRVMESSNAAVPAGMAPFFDGSALAENIRVTAGILMAMHAHETRLSDGAMALLMPEPDLKELRHACRILVRKNRLRNGALRVRYFRDGSFLVLPIPRKPFGRERLSTSAMRHYGPDGLQGRAKSNSMLPNLLAVEEAAPGAGEAVRLTRRGFVAEGAWSNIIIEKKGVLITPPLHLGVIDGTKRDSLIRHWKSRGKKVLERMLTRHDLYVADRVWVCSSRGLAVVSHLDGRKLGPLPRS